MRNEPGEIVAPSIVAPTAEEWRAMTEAERERFLAAILDALSDPRSAMAEGRPHQKAKGRAIDMLGLHFRTQGRVIYLAEEMAVVYPGEEVFCPDILAVVDVPQPEEDERLAWVVADEGRGLDWVLEVLHHGDRKKDLVENVERYAALGIPEYFVYDRGRQQIHGYRLPGPGARRYQRIVPQLGRYRSDVLGLDLAMMGGRLRFFVGMSELFGSSELIDRLGYMMTDLEKKLDDTQAQAERAQAQAERAQAQAERAQAQAEQAEARAHEALEGLREAMLTLVAARGFELPPGAHARVISCDDPGLLRRWLSRVATAGSAAEAFADGG